MRVRLLILLSFLLIACKTDSFFNDVNERWRAGFEARNINDNYESLSSISEPKGSLQSLLQVFYYDANFSKVSDCIFYKVATEFDGELFIISNPRGVNCRTLVGEKPYATIKSIRNFGIEQKDKKLILKIDTEKLEFTLNNIPRTRKDKLLTSSKLNNSLIASNINLKVENIKLAAGTICYDVDDECKEKVSFKCNECSGGFYSMVSHACSNKFRKICGVDHCGEKNQPACIRGSTTTEFDMKNYCINDSPAGFCNKGLRVVCINETLYCE